MNEIVKIFSLAGDKFIPEMHLRCLDLQVLVDHLQKTKKESKNLMKHEIYNIFTKTTSFFSTWHGL